MELTISANHTLRLGACLDRTAFGSTLGEARAQLSLRTTLERVLAGASDTEGRVALAAPLTLTLTDTQVALTRQVCEAEVLSGRPLAESRFALEILDAIDAASTPASAG